MKIKVRAWDGEQFVSPDYLDREGVAHWKVNSIPTSSEMVELWTGRQDKDNKEIYEGDTIVGRTGILYEVFWSQRKCGFGVRCHNTFGGATHKYIYRSLEWASRYRILGNIHENP